LYSRAGNLTSPQNQAQQLTKEFNILKNIDEQRKNKKELYDPYIIEKNRYNNILPFKYNCIKIGPEKNGYINASPIKTDEYYFVATQGPKEETVEDFWTMIWELNSKEIIMLCNLFENNKKKCENYWQFENTKFKVYVLSETKKENFYMRIIHVINLSNKEQRDISQIHFINWNDNGVINDNQFQEFYEINKRLDNFYSTVKTPIVVHCSAGCGRTGTFIAMNLIEKEIRKQVKLACSNIRINIFNLVRKLKEMRIRMVQEPQQYMLIYLFAQYLLNSMNRNVFYESFK